MVPVIDLVSANDRLDIALQYYLQCLVACSDGFTKPLPENVVDDRVSYCIHLSLALEAVLLALLSCF